MSDQPTEGDQAQSISAQSAASGRLIDTRAGGAALIYLVCSLLFFGRGLAGHLATRKIGIPPDPPLFMWFLKWWPFAIAHGINPFHTSIVWFPAGVNLTWSSAIVLPALAAAPLTAMLGPVASFNLLMLSAPVTASICAYLLCRRITGAQWPSILGGFIFGFSPYMLGQMLGHLHLVMVFPVPLAVLFTIDRIERRLSARVYPIVLGVILATAFLCAAELFATMSTFGAIALALAVFWLRPRLAPVQIIAEIAVAYLFALAIISPYLYAMFAYGTPSAALWPISHYCADLVNLFVPTTTNLLGTIGALARISNTYTGLIFENGACLTLPLIVICEAYRRRAWRSASGKLLIAMMAITLIAAFGPALHILGRLTIPMPWALAAKLPLIKQALPVRFVIYTFLTLSIIAALWLSDSSVNSKVKWIAAAAIVIFMLPNPSPAFWTTDLGLPAFFSGGSYRGRIAPGETILALPYGWRGASMLWQAESDYSFRMAGGWTTTIPFEFDRSPTANFFFGAIDLPEPGEQLKAFIAMHDVGAVVEDMNDPDRAIWSPVLADLDVTPIETGGVVFYPIAKRQFAPYAKLSGAKLEQRAVALRMDIVLQACAAYLADGNQVRDLSDSKLAAARLLPPDWRLSDRPDGFREWFVRVTRSGRVQIAMRGSYAALRPLAERYRTRAAKIEYPYPSAWSPGSSYPERRVNVLMVFEFDPQALAAAAQTLKASPPPERITPFLEATRSADEVNHE
jgi:hypothetical protein